MTLVKNYSEIAEIIFFAIFFITGTDTEFPDCLYDSARL